MSRRVIITSIVLVSVIVVITIIGAVIIGVPRFYSLTAHARPVSGIVVSKDPANHMSVSFEYRVGNNTYESAGRAEDIGKTFEMIQVGDEVPVTYDESNPDSAVMGDPHRQLNGSLRGTVFLMIGLTLSFLIYIWKRGH